MTEDSTHLKPWNIEDLSATWALNWVKNFHQLSIRPNMKYGHNPALCSWVIAVSIGHLTLDLLGIKCHGIITSSNWTFAWNCFIIAARALALQPKMCFFPEVTVTLINKMHSVHIWGQVGPCAKFEEMYLYSWRFGKVALSRTGEGKGQAGNIRGRYGGSVTVNSNIFCEIMLRFDI